ncbi:amidohydrolase family protein [Polymorphospora sp. NPDC051019]|uniref:amidohydrolase n=1 Tax=Polymorphospora sp. NPDC051019 TaxID=3155725 RepID=UPI00341586AB
MSTVFSGGTIRTMDPVHPVVDAVAIDGGVITAVGDADTVRAAAGPGATHHDLAGRTLLPGFVDPHHHLYLVAGDRYTRAFDDHPARLRDLLDRIAAIARADTGTGWLRLHGVRPLLLAEGRLPTAAELDTACPNRPLHLLSVSYHESTINSAGLSALGYGTATPDPGGGHLERDRRGRPTGVLVEQASFIAESLTRRATTGDADWVERATAHSRLLARHGITRIADLAVPPEGAGRYARAAPDLAVTVHRWHVGAAEIGDPTMPDLDPDQDPGHPRTPLGGFKLLIDGGERCDLCLTGRQLLRSAAGMPLAVLRHGRRALALSRRGGTPVRRPDGRWHNGLRVLDRDRLTTAVRAAVARGLTPALHAVGNGAVTDALDAVNGLGVPVRIEHAMICDPATARRLADSGAHVVAQPSFLYDLGAELTMLPLPAPLRLIPLRTMLDAGVPVAASSDYPAGTLSPLAGIQAAVTRRVAGGTVVHPEEGLTVEQALAAYTRDAAAALGMAGRAGVLRTGSAADLVELDRDPVRANPERIAGIRVTGTWCAGRRTA